MDHDEVLRHLKQVAKGIIEAKHKIKVREEYLDDYTREIGEAFLRSDIGQYLWDVFFNKNEYDPEFGESQHQREQTYMAILDMFLHTMSRGNRPQRVLVSGHIEEPEGYKVVGGKQLRICTSYGAKEPNKTLALIDASKSYTSVDELVRDLIPL